MHATNRVCFFKANMGRQLIPSPRLEAIPEHTLCQLLFHLCLHRCWQLIGFSKAVDSRGKGADVEGAVGTCGCMEDGMEGPDVVLR